MGFVIIEETAVAKGVRRIEAVTRNAAEAALATSFYLEQAFYGLEDADEAELPRMIKTFRDRLDGAVCGAVSKATLRDRLEKVQARAQVRTALGTLQPGTLKASGAPFKTRLNGPGKEPVWQLPLNGAQKFNGPKVQRPQSGLRPRSGPGRRPSFYTGVSNSGWSVRVLEPAGPKGNVEGRREAKGV